MTNEKNEVKNLYSNFAPLICSWCSILHKGRACAWRSLSNEYCPELGTLDDTLLQFENERKNSAKNYIKESSEETI